MKYLSTFVLLAILAVSFGCQQDTLVTDEDISSINIADAERVMVYSVTRDQNMALILKNASITDDEKLSLRKDQGRMVRLRMKAQRDIRSAPDWKEASVVAKKALADNGENKFQTGMNQGIGLVMLSKHLLSGKESQDKLEALSFYTELLVNENSPDASLLVPALKKLEGVWDQQKFNAAVASVNVAAQKFLDSNICTECNSGKGLSDIADLQQRQLYRMSSAVEELANISVK